MDIPWDKLVAWTPFISALASSVAAVIAIWALSTNRKAKRGDTIGWCMKTFYELERVKPGTGASNAITPEAYFQQLWGLMLVEDYYYQLGLIPPHLYVLWLWARHREIHDSSKKVDGISYKDGWLKIGSHHVADDDFKQFISWILADPNDTTDNITHNLRWRSISVRRSRRVPLNE